LCFQENQVEKHERTIELLLKKLEKEYDNYGDHCKDFEVENRDGTCKFNPLLVISKFQLKSL
jgi:hypothetical protein